MRLEGLRLQNYRVHRDSSLAIGNASFVILRGANGGGKSSFPDALSVNLAQTTVSLEADGDGYRDKIAQKEKQSIITAEIEGQHFLKSTVTLSLGAAGRQAKIECVDEPDNTKAINGFTNFLADRRDALLVALNTEFFSKQDRKRQTNLLAKLVLPSRYDFPKDKIEATNALLDTPINFEGDPFEVITSAHKQLYKLRESVNRQVKDFVIPEALPLPKGIDSESLQTQLTEIRAKRSNLQLERDTAVAKANEIEVKRATLQTTRENLLKRRDDDQKKLAAAEASILSDEDVAKLKAIEEKAKELADLKKQHSAYLGGMRLVDEQIDRLRDIPEKGATCPTCDQDIDGAKIEKLIADLKEEVVKADAELQKLDTKIEAIGDVDEAKEKIKKHEEAVKAKAEIEASLLKTVAEGKKTRSELDALPEKKDATLDFGNPLTVLQTQEDNINQQLRPVIAAEERAKEITRLTEQKAKLIAKAGTLNELTIYFDKEGVKKTLISQYIGSFESKINSVMGAFGCKTSLSFDPLGFDVTTSRGYVGPIKELCGAEAEIFKRAFQCAVSIASGIKMVVIDEMEELGIDIRHFLFGAVLDLIDAGHLEQAIFIEFSLDKTLPDPKKRVPNSRYFFVENGTVEVLG
jgi:hypothetical protein